MHIRSFIMAVSLSASTLLLVACGGSSSAGAGSGGAGSSGGGGVSSPALGALETTANASGCNSFSPVGVNGTAYPMELAGETPTAFDGMASPLNCMVGM